MTTGVLYLQRDKFQIYSSSLPSVLEFRYVPEMIHDLDVINKELLGDVISLFITHGKIPAGNLEIVLADSVCFFKDFHLPNTQPQEQGSTAQVEQIKKDQLLEQAKKYIDHIPFESINSKIIPFHGGIRVFATNKELYWTIKAAFEKNGFSVDMVIPGFLLGDNISVQPVLTAELGNLILQKSNSVKQENLLIPEIVFEKAKEEGEREPENYEVKEEGAKPKDNTRLIIMVGVFVVLIVALVIVYIMSSAPPVTK